MKKTIFACMLLAGASSVPALAGGLFLYETGTAEIGLGSAGYGARAQDASTVLSNPAGMTRLEGSQVLLGGQLLYAGYGFSTGSGTSPALGTNDGGMPVGWFPGGGVYYSYSLSPDLKLGFAATGNFGLSGKYDNDWVGRYYIQEATLVGLSMLPSIAYRVDEHLSLGMAVNLMYGIMKQQVAINTITGADGQLKLDDNSWGWGVNLGALYEVDPQTRFSFTYNSEVKLDFSGPAQFSGLSTGVSNALASHGLLDTNVGIGIHVPQQVMASMFHQLNDRWAVLGSVGWQEWSKFGQVELGIDSSNPVSLTQNLDFKDTWHVAAGAQYRISQPWLLNFGVAYDSGFQDNSNVSPVLPANEAWRFGIGAEKGVSKTFSWGMAAEYAYGGTLNVNKQSTTPVALGGRGNLVGSYNNTGILFLGAYANWKM
ncbi:MAG: outer membrane protein transport protein [Burkholderiales bacterium]